MCLNTTSSTNEALNASDRLREIRCSYDETVVRIAREKYNRETTRAKLEKEKETMFDSQSKALLEQLDALKESDINMRHEHAEVEREAAKRRSEAARLLEDAVRLYDEVVGVARRIAKEKNEKKKYILDELKDLQREVEGIKKENDNEEAIEFEVLEAIATKFNRTRAAKVIQRKWRASKKKSSKKKKKKSSSSKKKKSTTTS